MRIQDVSIFWWIGVIFVALAVTGIFLWWLRRQNDRAHQFQSRLEEIERQLDVVLRLNRALAEK
ncbi:hypothetical protein, partial [Anaerolinea sp.]